MLKRKQMLEMPIYKILDVSKIEVGEYQRDVNMHRVKEYSKDFNWNLFGVPLVSVRDGKFFTVDGQHRMELLKLLGIEKVMCQLIYGLSYEEEAKTFVEINSKRGSLSSNEKFHGRVEAKDVNALHLVDLLNKHGFYYAKSLGVNKDNYITAVSCVEAILNRSGDEHLERVLEVFRNSWCGATGSLKRDFLRGVSIFLDETKKCKR